MSIFGQSRGQGGARGSSSDDYEVCLVDLHVSATPYPQSPWFAYECSAKIIASMTELL